MPLGIQPVVTTVRMAGLGAWLMWPGVPTAMTAATVSVQASWRAACCHRDQGAGL